MRHRRVAATFAVAAAMMATQIIGGTANAETIEVIDLAGRTVSVAAPVERVILGEGRQMYVLATLDTEDPFGRVVGWRDDLKRADLDGFNQYLSKFPEIADIPLFGNPNSGGFSAETLHDVYGAHAQVTLDNTGAPQVVPLRSARKVSRNAA